MTDRGQAFTLEAFVASLLLLGSVAFALQVAGVTSLTTSSAGPQVESQLDGVAAGTLESAEANGTLRPTLLYWNETADGFYGAAESYYASRVPLTRFGTTLERKFDDRSVAFNVNIYYLTADGDLEKQRLAYYGTPSDDAVQVSKSVTLYDDDVLYNDAGAPSGVRLSETSEFYAPDAAPDSHVYNTAQVEVVIWRV